MLVLNINKWRNFMNKTKRGLAIAAGIIVLVYALAHFILMSIFAVEAASYYYYYSSGAAGLAIMFAIFGLISMLGGIFLIVSVKDPNKFAMRKNLYWAGIIITILMGGLVTFPSILLYISIAIPDNGFEKAIVNTNRTATGTSVNFGSIPVYQSQHEPEYLASHFYQQPVQPPYKTTNEQQYQQPMAQPVQQTKTDLEVKMDMIRDMKLKGEITEEEYKSLLFKLLS